MLPQLKSCCCGCSLRTGTLIIAWMSVIGAILGIFLGVSGAVLVDTEMKDMEEAAGQEVAGTTAATPTTDDAATAQDQKNLVPVFRAVLIVAILLCLLELIVTSLLLHGVYKVRPQLFKPWIACSIVALVFQCISTVGNIILHFATGFTGLAVLEMFFEPCVILIGLYYVCIVNSHRIELLTQNDSPKI